MEIISPMYTLKRRMIRMIMLASGNEKAISRFARCFRTLFWKCSIGTRKHGFAMTRARARTFVPVYGTVFKKMFRKSDSGAGFYPFNFGRFVYRVTRTIPDRLKIATCRGCQVEYRTGACRRVESRRARTSIWREGA